MTKAASFRNSVAVAPLIPMELENKAALDGAAGAATSMDHWTTTVSLERMPEALDLEFLSPGDSSGRW